MCCQRFRNFRSLVNIRTCALCLTIYIGNQTLKGIMYYFILRVRQFIVFIVYSAVDGGWGNWTSWNKCDKTCGKGQQARTRQCDKPGPSGGGKNCTGSHTERQGCPLNPCPGKQCFYYIECQRKLHTFEIKWFNYFQNT